MRMRIGVLLGLLAMSGCDILGIAQTCTLEARAGVTVVLVDSVTNGPILTGTVEVVATDGVYSDTVQVPTAPEFHNVSVGLVHERRGTYTVEVTAAGYHPWVASGIRVGETDDGCHVRTRSLTARLRPME